MGAGPSYSSKTYHDTVGAARADGKSMGHTRDIRSGKIAPKVHELLDPIKLNKSGIRIRECLDNADHPAVTPVIVAFDMTGSNSYCAEIAQDKLRLLFDILLRKGVLEDPAIAVAGYGDAYCDRCPLQISQFEAGNQIDAALDAIYLESGGGGNGGGNGGETATLLWYFLNKYTKFDSLDKRGKKPYFFMIADECALPLKPEHISQFIDNEADTELLTPEANAAALNKRFNVFILQIDNSSARVQNAQEKYTALFGEEHILPLSNPDNMVETIAAAIGAIEGTLTADSAVQMLKDAGASDSAVSTALTAVSGLMSTPAVKDSSGKLISAEVGDLNL